MAKKLAAPPAGSRASARPSARGSAGGPGPGVGAAPRLLADATRRGSVKGAGAGAGAARSSHWASSGSSSARASAPMPAAGLGGRAWPGPSRPATAAQRLCGALGCGAGLGAQRGRRRRRRRTGGGPGRRRRSRSSPRQVKQVGRRCPLWRAAAAPQGPGPSLLPGQGQSEARGTPGSTQACPVHPRLSWAAPLLRETRVPSFLGTRPGCHGQRM